ncbi:hypothetical protein M8J77_009282 [Diaphorina citri]|nr:hypothetical protein M8J77_009282 [Diaphorina citri]
MDVSLKRNLTLRSAVQTGNSGVGLVFQAFVISQIQHNSQKANANSDTQKQRVSNRKNFWLLQEWMRARGEDNSGFGLWKNRTPLGNAGMFIVLALLIGFFMVVIGCWLSDNCWSPEPEPFLLIA